MPEDILNPSYWRNRLRRAKELHQAIFICDAQRWQAIEREHCKILQEHIKPTDSILDAGCGWGRLLGLMPKDWRGHYFGVDLSPDFIELGRQTHPHRAFACADLSEVTAFIPEAEFDWGILISIRPMIQRNLGGEYWDVLEEQLKRVCKRLLFLEYDEGDKGEAVPTETKA